MPEPVNSKGELIARCIALGKGQPKFEFRVSGPPHQQTFHARVKIENEVFGEGEGGTKREAERAASEQALLQLQRPETPVLQLETNTQEDVSYQEKPQVWPVYGAVLAEAVKAAMGFAREGDTLEDIQEDAARFYRGLLRNLGHEPDIDE